MRYGVVMVWLSLGHRSGCAVQRRNKDYERKGCWQRLCKRCADFLAGWYRDGMNSNSLSASCALQLEGVPASVLLTVLLTMHAQESLSVLPSTHSVFRLYGLRQNRRRWCLFFLLLPLSGEPIAALMAHFG
jgi:hypothetical protein